ncbi:MAG TPA: PorP/SprF family type IX secretion system membrane protein [Bacteroidia bacterium]
MTIKKHICFTLFYMIVVCSFAQQTPTYTQFVLNQYGSNPAYAGTNLGMEAVVGKRYQWLGFSGAPTTTFGSFTFAWRKDFNYKSKQAIGIYVEDDRIGMFTSKSAYLSFSYHIKVFTGLNIAAGIFAGVRQIGLNNTLLYDPADPVLNEKNSSSLLIIYPDIIPGMRFYTKKLFIDVSVRQLYKNSMQQGSAHIGVPASQLDPTYTVSAKRKIPLGDNTWMLIPAVKAQGTYKSIPLLEANVMLFYNKTVGIGASIRGNSFACAIFQIKILKNIIAGFGYDYTISKLRTAGANSVELMLSFTPGGNGDDKNAGATKVANCPDFNF